MSVVHIISPIPMTEHSAQIIDVSKFTRLGFEVRLLDCTALQFPYLVGKHGKESERFCPVRIADSQALAAYARSIRSRDLAIFLGGISDRFVYGKSAAYTMIAERVDLRAGVIQADLPSVATVSNQTFPLLRRLNGAAQLAFQDPSALYEQSGWRIHRLLDRRIPKPLDYLFVGSSTRTVSRRILSESTRVIRIPTFDYERMRLANPIPASRPYAVFLDSMGPDHPDRRIRRSGMQCSSEEYAQLVRNALNSLKDSLGLDVLVAAHPRSDSGPNVDDRYAPYAVFKHATASLISGASAVITANQSTALGIAFALSKPIVVINSKEFGRKYCRQLDAFASHFGLTIVNADSPLPASFTLDASNVRYSNYVSEYMPLPSIPNQSLWSQITETLLAAR